jgi:hypothetical protein
MDPNAALQELLKIAYDRRVLDDYSGDDITEAVRQQVVDSSLRMADLVIALDQWFQRGGFMPHAWQMVEECDDCGRIDCDINHADDEEDEGCDECMTFPCSCNDWEVAE